jgi:hypothetical protein
MKYKHNNHIRKKKKRKKKKRKKKKRKKEKRKKKKEARAEIGSEVLRFLAFSLFEKAPTR